MLNYDIFILYARDDASFAKSVAKDLEKINISVLYKESLPRPSFEQPGPLRLAIENGFKKALYGIIIISQAFFKMDFKDQDLDFLFEVLLMESQILHPIWYKVSQADVSAWCPKLAMDVALQCPPETVDSMARKFQVKLAGSAKLQKNVLTGYHSQIQYIPPKISTYRPTKPSPRKIDLPEPTAIDDRKFSIDSSANGASKKEEKEVMDDQDTNDLLIADIFDEELRDQISKRLDVYLKNLSNWKDLAALFKIKSKEEIKKLQETKTPSLSLLGVLAQLGVTVGEFKDSCCKIERFDIAEYVDKYLGL